MAIANTTTPTAAQPVVSIVAPRGMGAAATHGVRHIEMALTAKGVTFETIQSPTSPDERAREILILDIKQNEPPESLSIARRNAPNKNGWNVSGGDDRGLMYAALDVADRIGWANDAARPLAELREASERPAVASRAVSIYTFHRPHWEQRFYDTAYWERYLDNLARNRFNSLVLIFGYENGGFLAPCYPYFFDLPEFPGVKMVGITPEEQARNLAALNRLIDMAHARGLTLTIGIWDHIYRGGVQAGGVPGAQEAVGKPTPHLVDGVNAQNLIPYTKAALAEFIRRVPNVDMLQFRMHWESGLARGEQERFWRDVFEMLKQQAPKLRFELRAKDLPDSVIQSAIDVGIDFRIETKFWMEQMGPPFHPARINPEPSVRRHSYADLLRYPRRYTMNYRMFNGGTSRVLLWGDPEYARRFAESCKLWDGEGFEINEPMISKMCGQTHDTQPFALLKEPRRYYQYEFERYWHFFQTFGRIAYNPQTPPEVFDREFARRFGNHAGPLVAKALHRASQVLPRIVAADFNYRDFPLTYGWPEKQRGGDLPRFAQSQGSDIELFASFDEEARLLLDEGETAKVRPPETSLWFRRAGQDVLVLVNQAEASVGDHRNKEFESTIVDLKILAHLALYHARRIPAAVNYRLFNRTRDVAALDRAITHEQHAIEAWRELVAAAGDFYADDLMFGARNRNLCGHWRDELAAMENDLHALEAQRTAAAANEPRRPAPDYRPLYEVPVKAKIAHEKITTAPLGQTITIAANVLCPSGVKWVRLRYRGLNQSLDYQTLPMERVGETDRYQATVPADRIDPAWDFMYFIEIMDNNGNGTHYPDFEKEAPYVVTELKR